MTRWCREGKARASGTGRCRRASASRRVPVLGDGVTQNHSDNGSLCRAPALSISFGVFAALAAAPNVQCGPHHNSFGCRHVRFFFPNRCRPKGRFVLFPWRHMQNLSRPLGVRSFIHAFTWALHMVRISDDQHLRSRLYRKLLCR